MTEAEQHTLYLGGSDIMARKTKTTGWIIEIVSGCFRQEFGRSFYKRGNRGYSTICLVEADVSKTRKLARNLSYDDVDEVVRKVKLDDKGRAVQIIPGR